MFLTYLILFFLSLVGDALGQITAAPSYPILAGPWHSRVGLLIQKRAAVTWCDSSSKCESTTVLFFSCYILNIF